MATQKERYADRILEMNAHMVALLDGLPEVVGTFFDNGWNDGGADPIVDGDVSSRLLSASEINSFITLSEQLKNFFGNSVVTQGDYASTVNKFRHAGS